MRAQLQRQLVPWPQSRVSGPPSSACHPGYQFPHQTQGGGAGQAWGKVSRGGAGQPGAGASGPDPRGPEFGHLVETVHPSENLSPGRPLWSSSP